MSHIVNKARIINKTNKQKGAKMSKFMSYIEDRVFSNEQLVRKILKIGIVMAIATLIGSVIGDIIVLVF